MMESLENLPVDAVRDLVLRMADDALIMAHRHSEWTGLGPLLEEDIAFSSIAQDKLGHAQALYNILHEHFGEAGADTLAFTRNADMFRSCQLVELPNGEYDRSLIRHLLFDVAEYFRYQALVNSTFQPLSALARKVTGEIKYHVYHAQTWVIQLGARGSQESHARMQAALTELWPYALGIFEEGTNEKTLTDSGVFVGERELHSTWDAFVRSVLAEARIDAPEGAQPVYGGRKGQHSEFLQPLLTEMTEVFSIDPAAEW